MLMKRGDVAISTSSLPVSAHLPTYAAIGLNACWTFSESGRAAPYFSITPATSFLARNDFATGPRSRQPLPRYALSISPWSCEITWITSPDAEAFAFAVDVAALDAGSAGSVAGRVAGLE